MRKVLFSFIAVLIASVTVSAQDQITPEMMAQFAKIFWQPKSQTIKLYSEDGPIRSTIDNPDFTEALLEVYKPLEPNGICVVMCPGGGYTGESQTYEGRDFAAWFNSRGITYCVLQYRLPHERHNVPLQDAEAAVKYLRDNSDELGISKIGIMGCSAGGHLASTLATHYSSAETRPDFQILLYPVITMDAGFTHMGSRENLLGKNPSQSLVDLYSNEKQVTKDTPAAFIVLASDDFLVPVENSTRYYESLVKNHVSASLFCYPVGNHGFGNNDTFLYRNSWLNELDFWIEKTVKKL